MRIGAMIDRKAMENELNQARLARIEAEAASDDLEELIWAVQHLRLGHKRVVFSIVGCEPDFAPAA